MILPKRAVIFVNGYSRTGKDTVVSFMSNHLRAAGIATEEFSSIEPVRDLMKAAGIDITRKTPEDRRLLSLVGDAVESHSGYRSRKCFRATTDFFGRHYSRTTVMFLHTREPLIIEKLTGYFKNAMFDVHTVLVVSNRRGTMVPGTSDAMVNDIDYGHVVRNEGSLDALKDACRQTLDAMGLLPQPELPFSRA